MPFIREKLDGDNEFLSPRFIPIISICFYFSEFSLIESPKYKQITRYNLIISTLNFEKNNIIIFNVLPAFDSLYC